MTRRQDGRDGAAGETLGDRVNRALLALCDEVERGDGGLTIDLSTSERPPASQRKVRIPRETRDRVNAIVARLPGISRDQFAREAIRRFTKAY